MMKEINQEAMLEEKDAMRVSGRYVRFGAFQMHLTREELTRNGQRLKIPAKVYQTLLVLVARAGKVVTREELCRRLWPGQEQKDRDASVNTTMSKLRQALEDTTEHPTYIETIPRRGYSFLASVEFSDSAAPFAPPLPEGVVVARTKVEGTQWAHFAWSAARLTPRRGASLFFGGMVIGALLSLVWSC